MSKWTIIYTDHKTEFIHWDYIRNSNPDAQILLADTSNSYDAKFAWRNGDLLIRNWLKSNKSYILNSNIAIIEWDVLISQKLPDLTINGILGRSVICPIKNKTWPWFRETESLLEYKQHAFGLAPLGVLFLDKICIDIITDSEFDNIYSKNIFSELRLPTILNSRGINISSYVMPNVKWHETPFKAHEPSIYHCVKTKIV